MCGWDVQLVSERQLDSVMDDVYEVNPDTPKIKTNAGQLHLSLCINHHSILCHTHLHHSLTAAD